MSKIYSCVSLSSLRYKFYGHCYVIAECALYEIADDRKILNCYELNAEIPENELDSYVKNKYKINEDEVIYYDDKDRLQEYDNHLLTDNEIAKSMSSTVL